MLEDAPLGCGPAMAASLAAAAAAAVSDWWGSDGNWWDDWWDDGSWWAGWDDGWGMGASMGPPAACGEWGGWEGPSGAQPVQTLPALQGPGDLLDEVNKFCDKYDLSDDHRRLVANSLSKCGELWVHDLKELDHALGKARSPQSLLPTRLRELEALRGFMTKAKQGHLPGCMCPNCKESSFARAVGTEGTSEAKSLNAAALFAYQHEQEALGGPREDEPDFAFGDKKGKGKGKPLVLPQGELLPEVKAFCSRFALTDRLTTKVMDTLRKRGDPEWRHDLAEMNRDLSKARNPSGLLVVKLGDLQKELNPNQLCFNYRAGEK
ncbi:unnamed protein product [Effrenium voratum]|nr:unnamed protein product [Effrenium voratum]